MNWILKNKKTSSETLAKGSFVKNKMTSHGKSKKALSVVLFLASVVLFSSSSKVNAGTTEACKFFIGSSTEYKFLQLKDKYNGVEVTYSNCCDVAKTPGVATGILETSCEKMGNDDPATYQFDGCQFDTVGKGFHVLKAGDKVEADTVTTENCCALAKTKFGIWDHCKVFKKGDAGQTPTNDPNTTNKSIVDVGAEVMDDAIAGPIVDAIKFILIGVLNLVGFLFSIAATLFSWVIDPANISGSTGVLNKQAVKDVWIMVRDLLNMTFILVLLFAAFCTIFQVDKWNLKKVWLSILINALLVNFSYPIARFFIDVSNVAFYYLVNNLFSSATSVTGSGIFAMFGASSGIGNILMPVDYANFSIAYLIAMIVILFIIGMTLLIVAALFTVRLVALIAIVMFSPIGFVGYIFPATSGFADKWWTALFSYSFFAPIMIFFIAVALKVTEAIGKENMASFKAQASANAGADQTGWIASAAFLFIPIIILWMGIGMAKSMGIAGADKVVGAVKKGGSWLANAPGHYSGINGGVKKGWENYKKKGIFGSDAIEERAAIIGRGLGDHHAVNDVQAKRVKEASDHHDMANMTDPDLHNLNTTGNEFEKAAAVLELANRGKATAENVAAIKGQFGDSSRVFNQLRNKVKTYDPTAAFATQLDATGKKVVAFDTQRMTEHLNSNQFDASKVNSDSLAVAEFVGLAMETGNMTPDDLAKLAKKGKPYADSIKKSLTAVLKNVKKDASGNNILDSAGDTIAKHGDVGNENNRNIHMAYLASTGEINVALETEEQKAEIIKRFDKDNAKKLSVTEIAKHADLIAKHVNTGKVKEVITSLSNESKKAFIDAIMNTTTVPTKEILALQRTIMDDHYLSALI